jgi:hypothetical protein
VQHIFNIQVKDFPFSEFQVQGIGLFDVIEHIKNDADFIIDLKTKCLKNTFIYITVPAHNWLWSNSDDAAGHYRRYDETMIKSLALKCKLDFIWGSYFFSYLPPTNLLDLMLAGQV